jgi:mannose-6-phosphate isomerase-like protein (cupin superfamily)
MYHRSFNSMLRKHSLTPRLSSKHLLSQSRRNMAHYITTHNPNGTAVFSPKASLEQNKIPIPIGDIRIISSSHQFPLNLSSEADIDQYQEDRISPFFPGSRRICPDGGTATCLISMNPGAESAMHRTMTLDTLVVVDGEIQITLESGETRTLKAGDSLVQRATMHKWKNITPNNGVARWVVFIQASVEPLQVGNKILGHEWAH